MSVFICILCQQDGRLNRKRQHSDFFIQIISHLKSRFILRFTHLTHLLKGRKFLFQYRHQKVANFQLLKGNEDLLSIGTLWIYCISKKLKHLICNHEEQTELMATYGIFNLENICVSSRERISSILFRHRIIKLLNDTDPITLSVRTFLKVG